MSDYKLPIIFALLLHVVVIGALLWHYPTPVLQQLVVGKPQKIVNAVTVNQRQVTREVNKIKQQRAARSSRLQHLQAQAKAARRAALAAKRQRQREQQRLATVRDEQRRVQHQLALRKRELAKRRQQEVRHRKRVAQRLRQREKRAAAAKRTLAALKKQQQAASSAALAKQLAAEHTKLAAAQARRDQSLIDKYKALIEQDISQNWLVPSNISKTLSCLLLINVGPGGVVLNVRTLRSSGDAVLDRSARTAVFKASPLPVPKNPALFDKFRALRLTVKPEILNPQH